MTLRTLIVPASVLALAFTASTATAEIVYLSSGKTLSVKSHRVEGESIILSMRNGGEVTCDRSIIERIVPDEVPHEEPKLEPAGAVPQAPASVVDPAVLQATP